MKIPQCSPLAGYLENKKELESAVLRVLRSGHYILGREVEGFEAAFAEYNGSGSAVGVASGTDALEIILRALELPEKSLILTAANTATATAAAVDRANMRVCFADIDKGTLNISPEKLEYAFASSSEPVKAVIAVHMFGNPCDLKKIKEICDKNGAFLIEDCAQSAGAEFGGMKVGNFGVAGAFSFYPTKNLGAFGDGGIVVTNNSELADRIRRLRQYGWVTRYESSEKGINSRLDEIQAAILSVKLPNLDYENRCRRALAAIYREELFGISMPEEQKNGFHVYHQFVVELENRDAVSARLARVGIGTMVHYPLPIHFQAAYRDAPCFSSMEVTERSCAGILSLPLFAQMSEEMVFQVAGKLKSLI